MTDLSVLIAGAGPTGLLAALVLARQGVPVRIVDRAPGPVDTSRAMGVQARTLEFYRMLGIADGARALGSPTDTVRIRRMGRRGARFSLAEMGAGQSAFPTMLTLAQDVHERFLLEKLADLGVTVERATELVELRQDHHRVSATLQRGAETEEVQAQWLIGADGASSTVRKSLGIGFGGGTSTGLFYVADVDLSEDTGLGILVGFGRETLNLLMPVRTRGTKRMIGIVPPDLAHRDDLTFEDIRDRAEGLLGVRATEVNWFSTYRVHHRVADRFRVGRCFIAGDAGHVHSPVGGQGMNTGLGDAMNLGWKLGHVVRGRASEAILETYHTERHAFAAKLIATTDAAFQQMISQGWLGRILRSQIAPRLIGVVTKMPFARRALFRNVSQTAIAYPDSGLSEGRAGKVVGGDRLPWLAEAENHGTLAAFDWQIHVHGEGKADLAAAAAAEGVPVSTFPWTQETARAGLRRDAAYLIRPDGHVAVAGATATALRSYIERHGLRQAEDQLAAAQ